MKYAIWNKTDDIYTLTGECIHAQDYISNRAAWAGNPNAKVIVGSGLINGTVFMEFNATVDFYKSQGMTVPEGATDDEILGLMEEWDNQVHESEASAEERIAAALEYQNLLSM